MFRSRIQQNSINITKTKDPIILEMNIHSLNYKELI